MHQPTVSRANRGGLGTDNMLPPLPLATVCIRATLAMMYERLAGSIRARQLMCLLMAEGPKFPDLTDLYYSEVVARGIDLWKRLIARGIERGEFRSGRISDNPQVIYGPALMAAIWQLLFGARHALDLESWFESHLDLILKGLEKRDAVAGQLSRRGAALRFLSQERGEGDANQQSFR